MALCICLGHAPLFMMHKLFIVPLAFLVYCIVLIANLTVLTILTYLRCLSQHYFSSVTFRL
jgi:hypothetical protein